MCCAVCTVPFNPHSAVRCAVGTVIVPKIRGMIKDRARLELRAPVSKVQVPPSLLHRLLICNRGQVSQQTELSEHWVVLGSHMAPGHLCRKASWGSGMESPSAPLSVDCDPSLARGRGAWVSKPFGNNICLSRCFNFKAIHLPHPKSL